MTPLNPQGVEQTGKVVCHIGNPVGLDGLRAAAGVAVVDQDHLELRGKDRDLRQRTKRRVLSDSHHQNQRGSFSMKLVVQVLSVRLYGARLRELHHIRIHLWFLTWIDSAVALLGLVNLCA